ncbi:MAG: GNAT family N-acetyltransferase [Ruminococcaceae bacterium]|nr:GNAT family N-acetyltransferase [Oscillospiraceae bacterium]
MEIISFYETARQTHWLNELRKSDWRAGAYLCELLSNNTFYNVVGEGSKLLLLTDGDKLISFCTFAKKDEIQTDELSPWIGFIYTFPEYRGHHYIGLLFEEIESLAKKQNISAVYISTDHIGLYEKYGFEYLAQMESIYGELSRVYVKQIK